MNIFRILLLAAASTIPLIGNASAQVPPDAYSVALGATPIEILPTFPGRKKVTFHNQNDHAQVAVCPRVLSGTTVEINGAGCVTIAPDGRLNVSGGLQQSAWDGVASAPASAITITELK